ncbi:Glutamyl-tRNA reductase [Galdieria sulphuraria]|nr:Glutamyl-tRNA reductase [Galdieria sulphuraria]
MEDRKGQLFNFTQCSQPMASCCWISQPAQVGTRSLFADKRTCFHKGNFLGNNKVQKNCARPGFDLSKYNGTVKSIAAPETGGFQSAKNKANIGPLKKEAFSDVSSKEKDVLNQQLNETNNKGSDKSRRRKMTQVVVVGLSHRTATVETRERLSVPEPKWQEYCGNLKDFCPSVTEVAVLSTCNRFEVYFVAYEEKEAILEVMQFLSSYSSVPINQLRKHLFVLCERMAVWHIFRVAGGLDSLVVGEGQILSQMKQCYQLSCDKKGQAGKVLKKLLNSAVAAGKRVRSETGISKGAVSISSAAVELGYMKAPFDINKSLTEASNCIIGAGNMARLLVQHLIGRGCHNITVVNRSYKRAEELKEMFSDVNINIWPWEGLMDVISTSEVIFTCTSSSEPILCADHLRGILADSSGTLIIDISVPRNVASDVKEIPFVSSYNVDDLKAVVAQNQARRRKLVQEAETLLTEELNIFCNWHHSLGAVPAITRLQERAESIRAEELERVVSKLRDLTESEREAVEKVTKDIEERSITLKSLEALFKLY